MRYVWGHGLVNRHQVVVLSDHLKNRNVSGFLGSQLDYIRVKGKFVFQKVHSRHLWRLQRNVSEPKTCRCGIGKNERRPCDKLGDDRCRWGASIACKCTGKTVLQSKRGSTRTFRYQRLRPFRARRGPTTISIVGTGLQGVRVQTTTWTCWQDHLLIRDITNELFKFSTDDGYRIVPNGRLWNIYAFIVDGIYPNWPIFIKPLNRPGTEAEKRYSKKPRRCAQRTWRDCSGCCSPGSKCYAARSGTGRWTTLSALRTHASFCTTWLCACNRTAISPMKRKAWTS